MKCLAYCILPEQGSRQVPLPRGREGELLGAAVEDALAIVFARAADTVARPPVPELLAYARVIEALHQRGPVLPMRYGCLFANEDQVRDCLRKGHAVFEARLRELEGCSDISVRVLHEVAGGERKSVPAVPRPATGAAYLADRRTRYLERESQSRRASRLGDTVRQVFEGLFRACRTEQIGHKGFSSTALHFLVAGELAARFRDAFHQFQLTTPLKLLLTGPWPPYNFAACEYGGRQE